MKRLFLILFTCIALGALLEKSPPAIALAPLDQEECLSSKDNSYDAFAYTDDAIGDAPHLLSASIEAAVDIGATGNIYVDNPANATNFDKAAYFAIKKDAIDIDDRVDKNFAISTFKDNGKNIRSDNDMGSNIITAMIDAIPICAFSNSTDEKTGNLLCGGINKESSADVLTA